MTLEELKTRYENKQYAEKQTECMKKLLSYRQMLEYRDEAMQYAGRIEEFQKKIDFALENKIHIPIFIKEYRRRIDDDITARDGKRKFCWIYNENDWGTFENGEIVAYTRSRSSFEKIAPTEELYKCFLYHFPLMEEELDELFENYLKGF